MFSQKGSKRYGHLDGLKTSDYGSMTTISSYEHTSDYRSMTTISSYEQTSDFGSMTTISSYEQTRTPSLSSVNIGPKELVCFIDNILQSLHYKYF